MPDFDTVVLGAGLGGLTCANRLAQLGRRVLVLEQHHEPGGLAAWFRRGGFVFDTALHGFPVGMRKTLRKYWSREIADAVIRLDAVRFHNPQFSFSTPFDTADFSARLVGEFGIPPATVERFFATCRAMNFYDDRARTTRDLFAEFFPGRSDVVRFLMEPITYANGSTLDEPALTYGIVFSNFMSEGVFTVRGGTDWLMAKMAEELARNGARLLTSARAVRILTENGRVTGVRYVRGGAEETVACRSVVSNADLRRTVLELLGPDSLPAEFLREAGQMRLSTSVSQVYLGLREGFRWPAGIGDILFWSEAPEFTPEHYLAPHPRSMSFSFYDERIRPAQTRCSVVASIGARAEDWAGDAEAVREGKRRLVARTLEVLERFAPGAGAAVEVCEAASPRTFERYTGHPGGATFGTKFEGLAVSEGLPRALPGAFHAGSCGILMSGWLGAANYGVLVSNKVEEYLGVRS